MENERESKELRRARRRNLTLSILVCVVCGLALLLPMRGANKEAYRFEVAQTFDAVKLRANYAENGDSDALYRLMLTLCREAYLEGETFDPAELRDCGRELYRRAKAGEIDLEKIGDPTDTTAMLALLKDFGVTPTDS